MGKSFEQYLLDGLAEGKIDFHLRAQHQKGETSFYIHPSGQDGEAADFKVIGGVCFHGTDRNSMAKMTEHKDPPVR